jgi:hypothetical protein
MPICDGEKQKILTSDWLEKGKTVGRSLFLVTLEKNVLWASPNY